MPARGTLCDMCYLRKAMVNVMSKAQDRRISELAELASILASSGFRSTDLYTDLVREWRIALSEEVIADVREISGLVVVAK